MRFALDPTRTTATTLNVRVLMDGIVGTPTGYQWIRDDVTDLPNAHYSPAWRDWVEELLHNTSIPIRIIMIAGYTPTRSATVSITFDSQYHPYLANEWMARLASMSGQKAERVEINQLPRYLWAA